MKQQPSTWLVLGGAALCLLAGGVCAGFVPSRSDRVAAVVGRIETLGPAQFIHIGNDDLTVRQVNNTGALTAALRRAKPGDTVALEPGVYYGFSAAGLQSFDEPVTITSADPAKPAVLTDFSLDDVHGLRFRNLEFLAVGTGDARGVLAKAWAFKIVKSSRIHLDNVSVHGSLDGDVSNDVSGIQVRGGEDITIENSEFQQLGRAIAIGVAERVKISNNNVHDIRSDGFDFAQVANVEIVRNTLRNFYPIGDDHPDAIQFWTSGTKQPTRDVLISENVIMRAEGRGTQGIFLTDQVKALPYERITISNNLILGTGYNAVRVQGAKDVTITGNDLVTFAGDYKTFMLIIAADGVVARNNRAISIGFGSSTNVKESGNVKTSPVKDKGRAALHAWLRSRPARATLLEQLLPPEAESSRLPAKTTAWVERRQPAAS